MAGKGDRYRPVSQTAFSENYHIIFGAPASKQRHTKCLTCFGAGVVPNPEALYGERGVRKCPNPKCDDGLVPEEIASD